MLGGKCKLDQTILQNRIAFIYDSACKNPDYNMKNLKCIKNTT